MNNLSQLPKVELHLHLDCSLSYDVVHRLNPAITREAYEREFIAPTKCADLADFLTRAPKGCDLMQTEESLRLVTADLFAQLARDQVIYAEIRFAPLLHTFAGLSAEKVVAIIDEAVAQAVQNSGIQARLILCTLRHYTEAQSLETVRLVEQFQSGFVAGFDIAADEAGFPIDAHRAAFRYAIDRGIPRTAHAGEARGPESVWETLQHFQPSRIGHGVRSIEDPALVEYLQEKQIHLEICPTCNVQIDVYPTFDSHPIDRLHRAGVSVNLNTDTRTITNVTLTEEYNRMQQTFGWQKEDFLQTNLNAVRAAFLPEAIKQRMANQLRAAYQQIEGDRT